MDEDVCGLSEAVTNEETSEEVNEDTSSSGKLHFLKIPF